MTAAKYVPCPGCNGSGWVKAFPRCAVTHQDQNSDCYSRGCTPDYCHITQTVLPGPESKLETE